MSLARTKSSSAWRWLPAGTFLVVSGWWSVGSLLDPRSIGSHALLYTDAARAMVTGGDPWAVGPPSAVFAGPPLMLIPFVPFTVLPPDLTRAIWVLGMAAVAVASLRRLGLPPWWIAFPPLWEAIVLGHPEPLVLGFLLLHSPAAGLAAIIKPYAALPLLAGWRWRALLLAAVAVLLTAPVLPWPVFLADLPTISANLARQSLGDGVADAPVLAGLAVISLLLVGWRRGLWLATPLLWPNPQPTYKVASMPAMSPLLATLWALPVPGATLLGIVAEAALVALSGRGLLPRWLGIGLIRTPSQQAVTAPAPTSSKSPL